MRAVPLRTVRQADAPAKLALLECLLGVAEVGECIDRTLSWLCAHTQVTQAICALATAESGQLRGVAGHRVTAAQVESVSVGLDDTIHPLNRAMEAGQPTQIGGPLADQRRESTPSPGGPFGRSPYWALPLETHGAGQPAGGLLLVVLDGTPSGDVTWVAEVLSQKLHILLTRDTLAEGQNKFRRERSLLDAIINAVADPILLTDTEGRLLIANSRAEALFSTPAGVSEGRRRAVELNNMFLSAALWRIAVGAGQVKPQELLVVDPVDGSDLLFELLGTVVHDQREGTGIVSVLRNVTDLRRATEELSENYRRMRLAEAEARTERDRLDVIIDSVADPIIVSDDAGKVTLMNAPAERLFTGASDDEVLQRRLRANDAHFSSFIAGLLSEGSEVRRRGEVSLTELTTGMPLPFEAIAGKVLSEVGEFVAVVTILHDRSEALERARLYEQVKRASDELEARVVAATAELARQNTLLRHQAVELEQASALKSQFLANMSHEFRTPLNAILGYASILLQGISGELTPAQRKALDRIASNGRHLVGIISEILDLSRIEAGRMPLQVSTFTLTQLVEEVQAEMEPIIARSKLAVSSHIPSDIGPIVSDRQKIKQILLNLLSNALKFTREGSVTIRAASAEPDLVTIAIADTGIGIDPADHEKIFEDFQQVDSSVARPYGGTGLGLSICRRLATMLGGRLDMKSEVGRGSTFTLFLASRLKK